MTYALFQLLTGITGNLAAFLGDLSTLTEALWIAGLTDLCYRSLRKSVQGQLDVSHIITQIKLCFSSSLQGIAQTSLVCALASFVGSLS